MIPLRARVAAVGVALTSLQGCGAPGREPAARHLVLITLDTTRADRLGCYGRKDAGTPWLDTLAARGTRFERAYSAVPLTLPSHVTILTGLYPAHTGVHVNGQARLLDGVRTLPEILTGHGFFAAAAIGGYPVSGRFPVRRGFEAFDDRLTDTRHPLGLERDGGEVVRAALGELSSRGNRRMFLWVHLYDPHDPYEPPTPFRERFAGDLYQGEIARADAALAELTAGLAAALHDESVLICVVGDHGEALGEHGEDTHGFFVYEPTVRVPLILSGPRVPRGERRSRPVSTVDLVPTLLALLDLPSPAGLDGRAVEFESNREPPPRPLYLETELPLRSYGWSALHAAVDGATKLIDAPRREIYDLARDPGETANLASDPTAEPPGLGRWISTIAGAQDGAVDGSAQVDPRLRSLGYVAAGARRLDPGASRPDPKDRLSTYRSFTAAARCLERGDAASALPLLDRLVAEDDTAGARFERAAALRMLGRLDDARAEMERVVSMDPGYPGVHLEKMRVAAGRRDWKEARAEAEASLRENPDEAEAFLYRGAARELSGEFAGAEADYRRALEVNPGYGNASLRLAALLVRAGRTNEARALLRSHLEMHPGDTLARGLLGSI